MAPIDTYSDYRLYLRAWFDARKHSREGYSLRRFAEEAGLKSPAYVKFVLDGTRNLSPKSARSFARAMQLTESDTRAFTDLVGLRQARSLERRAVHLKRLARREKFRESHAINADTLDFLQNWYIPAIRELARTAHFQPDPDWIVAQLRPALHRHHAKAALDTLLRLGFLERVDETYRVTQANISTPNEFRSTVIAGYHRQWAKMGMWAIENIDASERNFGAVTGIVHHNNLPQIMERVHQMRNEFSAFLKTLESTEADSVVQVNFQAFPLTHKPQGDSLEKDNF